MVSPPGTGNASRLSKRRTKPERFASEQKKPGIRRAFFMCSKDAALAAHALKEAVHRTFKHARLFGQLA